MKNRILALILSLMMIFTSLLSIPVQAAELNYDLSLRVSLDSLKSNGVITNDTQFINDGGYAIYPEQTTSLNYKIIVGAQSGLYEDITVEEITCYYDANLSFEQMNCYYGNVSNDANYTAEIVSSESVEIDGVLHNSLKIKNLSLGSVYTSVIFLTFDAPRGYSGIFNDFYCEISKGDKRYIDSDSTAGNALNNGSFDSINEDDAKAFLNENNLIACPYGLKYEVNNESVKITDYICKDSVNSLYIPSKIEGLSVTEIGDGAFKDCATSFNTVFVPSSVKNILSGAFSNTSGGDPTLTYPSNTSIKNMIISEGVSWISGKAFYNSMDLEKVSFPNSVSTIGGVKIGGINYYGYILSCGLYLYNELPNPSIKEISVIKDSYADGYFKNITYNNVATFADLISYGKKVYTVHYDTSTNGGDWKNNDTRPASAGDTVNLTLTASKNGSRFIGWNTDPNATNGLSSLKMENSDVVLYAIFEKTLSSISVESKPTKITYEIGESLNTNGLKLKLKYSDGSTETITSGFTTSGFSSTTAGTKTVTVKYGGLTTTFTVTVNPAPVPETSAQLVMSSTETMAGKEVTLTLSIKNNPGVAGLAVSLKYDENVLTLKDSENGDLFSGFTAAKNFAWDESEDVTDDGELATFTFTIAENVPAGEYGVEVIVRSCTNEDLDDVELLTTNGIVSVIDFVYGDSNGDNKIDMKDVVLLRKYITNFDYDTNTSSVNVELGADANGDNKIDMKDVVILRKYITNYDYDTESSTVVLGPQ